MRKSADEKKNQWHSTNDTHKYEQKHGRRHRTRGDGDVKR